MEAGIVLISASGLCSALQMLRKEHRDGSPWSLFPCGHFQALYE